MLARVTTSSTSHELPLSGGRLTAGVVRVGDTVRRPTGPHSAFVHALLMHLEAVGFAGAPRLLGMDDQGREILSYLAGWVPPNLDRVSRQGRPPGRPVVWGVVAASRWRWSLRMLCVVAVAIRCGRRFGHDVGSV